MKSKKTGYVGMSVFATLLLCGFWTIVGFTHDNFLNDQVILRGMANKESFVLGEPVTLQFEVVNRGKTSVTVGSGGVETGSLKIFIATQAASGEYKEYFRGSWGCKRGKEIPLSPEGQHKYEEFNVLWNGKPKVSHLNEQAAERVLAGKITTEYAFQEPGVYFVKGRSFAGPGATPIDSEPIRIEIKQPEGDDLEVWNRIKGNKEFAYLMQDSTFDTQNLTEKQYLIGQVEQFILQYPNTVYSAYMKPSLEKYKNAELRRKDAAEKATIKPDK